ncbi:MAG TPA: hypothetical protein VNG12_11900 [Acidimicrobiales bacterium]|nr:hypothetical protein [Acidimicrobiales bacterium]
MEELIGLADIGRLLGVSRQRARVIAETTEGFPPPAARVGLVGSWPAWRREDVEAWARETGRLR